ncbi:hypothetical protein ACF0H5_004916 [Mactra antiquata]
MSTEAISSSNKENSANLDNVKKISLTSGMTERKSLKTLQLSSDGRLYGSENSSNVKRIVPSKKPVKIFPDSSTPKLDRIKRINIGVQVSVIQQDSETQTEDKNAPNVKVTDSHNDSGFGVTDIDQEAYDLMVKDPIPENYWRELAEERRLSLAEALAENEMLHQSMEELKEENQNLSLLAGQAEHLASVLNNVLGGDDDADDNDDNRDNTDSDKTNELNKDKVIEVKNETENNSTDNDDTESETKPTELEQKEDTTSS